MTYREDAQCPICGSLERHRAAFLLLGGKISPNQKVLHVAPEPLMIPCLVSCSCEYLNIDLYNPAMRMDLMNIELPNDSKTLVWCSHVLEHVLNDRKALSKCSAYLRPRNADTAGSFEAKLRLRPYRNLESERLEKFLREDHIRLYGLDLKSALRRGFRLRSALNK
jgi:hypothetical protein